NKGFQSFLKNAGIQLWNTHALAGAVQPFQVILHPEDPDASIFAMKGLHAFKYGLPVMQRCVGGRDTEIAEGDDLGHLPIAMLIFDAKHMVGKMVAKTRIIQVYFVNTALFASLDMKVIDQLFLFRYRRFTHEI